jgi:NAD(P)-dependent dehydrogenase (short-subunit alcohol dehydrogenase family)
MDLGLQDKVAIITGSSRGLGLASARALVAEGCRVCLCARGAEALAEAALEVEAAARRPNMVVTVQADVSTNDGVERIVERTIDAFGGIDVLVNNVGRAGGTDLLATSDAEWQAAFDETLFPAIRASRLVVPSMRARGGGAIIMIRRADDVQRREGGRDQPVESAGAAACAAQHPRQQRRSGLDPVSGRLVAQAPAGGPAGDRRVRPSRAAVRPFRTRRRSRRRRRVSRLSPCQLDQRCLHPRRRLSKPFEYLDRIAPIARIDEPLRFA